MKLFCVCLAFLPLALFAQREQLSLGNNTLENTTELFDIFRLKMDSLNQGKCEKVRIVHIGDSHIQPDNLSGITRKKFQATYGNGGRGLVFPYTLAKTNGPKDFLATSATTWTNSWIINYPHKFAIGMPGIGIKSTTETGAFSLELRKDSIINPYSRGFLLYSFQDPKKGTVTVNKSITKTITQAHFDTLSFNSPLPQSKLDVAFSGAAMTLHGVYVENDQAGVVYNAAGVAGARYRDYLRNDFFIEQLPLFAPDLVIISLGTNETYDPSFTEAGFRQIVDSMFTMIHERLPKASVLITLPSENYRVKNGVASVNQRIPIVTSILREESVKHGFAVWDLFEAMGGEGSMLEWKKAGLVNEDHIHYLRKGYNLQGELLFEAIDKGLSKQ
jgi:lysophospholipase L1-like esterase